MEVEKPLSKIERAEEILITGLRLKSGIDKNLFKQKTGMSLDDMLNQRNKNQMIKLGFVHDDSDNIRLSDGGLLLLDSVVAKLIG